MRTATRAGAALLFVCGALLATASPASGNVIAGAGYSSSFSGESAFTNVDAGGTGQFSAVFFNTGTQIWQPGVVGLLVCAADKTTCNVPVNTTFNRGWYSNTVYATVTSPVAPGQNGFFLYSFAVPASVPGGTVTTFYGDVGLIATGAVFRPEGYYQVNSTPNPVLSLTIQPSTALVGVSGFEQFSVTGQPAGAPVSWSVTGGCGAVTQTGLFVGTAMNSNSQPCSVVATAVGWKGTAPITVFGPASQLVCIATPTRISADGGTTAFGKATATIMVKDANGNLVGNATSPLITITNVTPFLGQFSPAGSVAPSNGLLTVTIASSFVPGDIQLSAVAPGLSGCNVIVTSATAGPAVRTIASFSAAPIAADNLSTTTLQVDITDANGVRVLGDNLTQIAATLSSGIGSCRLIAVTGGSSPSVTATFASAVASQGRVSFLVQAGSTPATCVFTVTTNNTSIAGTSVSVETRTVGAPSKLAIISNDSPHPASNTGVCDLSSSPTDASCTRIVVGVQDANGVLLTGDSGRIVSMTLTPGACTGAGGDVLQRGSTSTVAGKATFAFSSAGSYVSCGVNFTSTNLVGVSATMTWTAAIADHLSCAFVPDSMPSNTYPAVTGTVSVRDRLGNLVTTGTYSVALVRTSGNTTTLATGGSQYTSAGTASFTLFRQGTNVGVDVYAPALGAGTLPQTAPNTSCTIIGN
jgi:hypothetical protein